MRTGFRIADCGLREPIADCGLRIAEKDFGSPIDFRSGNRPHPPVLFRLARTALCAISLLLIRSPQSAILAQSAILQAQTAPRGKAVYDKWCAACHGDDGAGAGDAATYMLPQPRDFTKGVTQCPVAEPHAKFRWCPRAQNLDRPRKARKLKRCQEAVSLPAPLPHWLRN